MDPIYTPRVDEPRGDEDTCWQSHLCHQLRSRGSCPGLITSSSLRTDDIQLSYALGTAGEVREVKYDRMAMTTASAYDSLYDIEVPRWLHKCRVKTDNIPTLLVSLAAGTSTLSLTRSLQQGQASRVVVHFALRGMNLL